MRTAFYSSILLLVLVGFGVFVGSQSLSITDIRTQLSASISSQLGNIDVTPQSTGSGDITTQTTGTSSSDGAVCGASDSAAAACSNKYFTRYVISPGPPPAVEFCKIDPEFVQEVCTGQTPAQCQQTVDGIVDDLTELEGQGQAPGTCEYGYRGNVSCFSSDISITQRIHSNSQLAAAAAASSITWKCCKEGSLTCQGAPNPALFQQVSTMGPAQNPPSVSVDGSSVTPVGTGQNVDDFGAAFNDTDGVANVTPQDTTGANASDFVKTSTGGDTASVQAVDTGKQVSFENALTQNNPAVPGTDGATSPYNAGVAKPDGPVAQNTSPKNPYESLKTPKTLQKPNSFIQKFVGESLLSTLGNFITGQAALRTTPEGEEGDDSQRVVVVPQQPQVQTEYRNIQTIASDVAAQTQVQELSRVDHFAHTLETVGGPNEINTENKSFGRIQDLIIEDEAIRSLRVAEEEGKRAKNTVFCRTSETAEACEKRREEKAQEVERATFVEELEERVLPETAIQHFLAVYDGWIRPSPAPETYATSTLGLLNSDGADYSIISDGTNIVTKVFDTVAQAVSRAVSTFTDLILGGRDENETELPQSTTEEDAPALGDVVAGLLFTEPEFGHSVTHVSGSELPPNIPEDTSFNDGIEILKEAARSKKNEYAYAYVTKNSVGRWVFVKTLGEYGGTVSTRSLYEEEPDSVMMLHTHPGSWYINPPSMADINNAKPERFGVTTTYGSVDRNGLWEYSGTDPVKRHAFYVDLATVDTQYPGWKDIVAEESKEYQEDNPNDPPFRSLGFVLFKAENGEYGERMKEAAALTKEVIQTKGQELKSRSDDAVSKMASSDRALNMQGVQETLAIYRDLGVEITTPPLGEEI